MCYLVGHRHSFLCGLIRHVDDNAWLTRGLTHAQYNRRCTGRRRAGNLNVHLHQTGHECGRAAGVLHRRLLAARLQSPAVAAAAAVAAGHAIPSGRIGLAFAGRVKTSRNCRLGAGCPPSLIESIRVHRQDGPLPAPLKVNSPGAARLPR